jgi:hypothetical protein
MPRFFLHISNGVDGFVEDPEGQELQDEAAARRAAIVGARDMMAADLLTGELDLGSFIEVEDENRQWLFTLTFADAVMVKGQHQQSQGRTGRHTEH